MGEDKKYEIYKMFLQSFLDKGIAIDKIVEYSVKHANDACKRFKEVAPPKPVPNSVSPEL